MLAFVNGGLKCRLAIDASKVCGCICKRGSGRARSVINQAENWTKLREPAKHGKFMRLLCRSREVVYAVYCTSGMVVWGDLAGCYALIIEASSAVRVLAICNSALIYVDGTGRTHQL